jgi:hypothetical protein
MFFARRPAARPVVSHWLIALGVATVGLLLQRQPAHLTDPANCPGLLEWLVITASGSGSRVPVATYVAWLNGTGVFLSLVAVTRLIQRAADSLVATTAVSLAAAVTIVTTPTLAPSDVLAIGAASVAWGGKRPLGSFLLAVVSPALALPLGAAAAWLAWEKSNGTSRRRLLIASLAAIVVIGLAVAQTVMIPGLPGQEAAVLPGCLIPREPSVQNLRITLAHAFEGTGPAPLAFALLGVFALWHGITQRASWPLIAMAILPLVAAAGRGADPVRTLAPAIAAFWWLVGVGAREVVTALAARPSWRIAAWVFALLLPVLQWSHRSAMPVPAADEPRGHESLTRRDISSMLGALPTRATIVMDDAITSLLMRSWTETGRQTGKVFTVISRDGQEAARPAADAPLFALPRAQFDLQHQGLARVEIEPRIPGVVAFARAGPCSTVEGQWREAKDLGRSSSLALVSNRPAARGPVVIYLGSSAPLNPHPIDWPSWTMRGYHAATYEMGRDADRPRLDFDGIEDRAPRDDRVFAFPYVTRLDVWRVPGGPMILPIGFDQAPEAVLARGVTAADRAGLRLCPSYPAEIERLEVRR